MKIKVFVAITWLCLFGIGNTQTTVFTYQGRLSSSGAPANGLYDLRFLIYDAAIGGNSLGTITKPFVIVSNGLFTTQLDFGSNVFDGNARWLSIDVRNIGDLGPYVTLAPRLEITAAPYAIQAGTAAKLDGQVADGQLSSNIPRLNGSAIFPNVTTFSNASGNFFGNGAGMSNVNASLLNGVDASAFWKTGGNSNTSAGNHFVGTTDGQPLEFKVNNSRALWIEPTVAGTPNVTGGAEVNVIDGGVVGSVIAGGGATNFGGNRYTNRIAASLSLIGTGLGNVIQSNAQFAVIGSGWSNGISFHSTYSIIGSGFRNDIGLGCLSSIIGSGWMNVIDNYSSAAFIGTGQSNKISYFSDFTVIPGGYKNVIGADSVAATVSGGAWNTVGDEAAYSLIGGGFLNTISDDALAATIPGGYSNVAAGFCSFAAGRNANANHDGTFVWADNRPANFTSTGTNQFLIRAEGGVGIGTNHPATALHVNGVVTATSFQGDGSTLQNLDAAPALQRLNQRLNEQTSRLEQKEHEIQLLRRANEALEKRLGELENRLRVR